MAEVHQRFTNHQIYLYNNDRKDLKEDLKEGKINKKEFKKLDKELENQITECQISLDEAFKLDEEGEETPINNMPEDDSLALKETKEA